MTWMETENLIWKSTKPQLLRNVIIRRNWIRIFTSPMVHPAILLDFLKLLMAMTGKRKETIYGEKEKV